MKKRTDLIKIIWYADTGRNKVFGRAWGYWFEVLSIFTFLKVYGITLSYLIMGTIFILLFILFIIFGYLYIKFKFFEIEQEFNNNYNPMLKRIEEGIKHDNKNN